MSGNVHGVRTGTTGYHPAVPASDRDIMAFCWFAHFRRPIEPDARLDDADIARVREIVTMAQGLTRVLLHTPAPVGTRHPFPNDEPPPQLALQLYADTIEPLEEALRPEGALQALVGEGGVPGLRPTLLQQQVMLVRHLDIDPIDPAAGAPRDVMCSYLVHYPGHAADLDAWHRHYLDHHPRIMRTFPRIREIEICTRVDWVGGLPGMRVEFMQRNKQVFDTPEDLSAAMFSPVIGAMRADFHRFPAFAGGNVHYPMSTYEPAATAGIPGGRK